MVKVGSLPAQDVYCLLCRTSVLRPVIPVNTQDKPEEDISKVQIDIYIMYCLQSHTLHNHAEVISRKLEAGKWESVP